MQPLARQSPQLKGVTLTTPDQSDLDPRWRLTPTKIVVAALLLVGIVVPLLVGTYDQINPRLFGFPFFYWYQLMWVFLAAALCATSFVLLKRESDAYRRRHDDGGNQS